MALIVDFSPLRNFIESFSGTVALADWLWQFGVAGAAIVLGFFTARLVTRQFKPSGRWKFGEGDFERVAYPLFAWIFMGLGRLILARYQAVPLLDILVSVLVAWIAIRIAVYILGHILPQGAFLRSMVRAIGWIAWIGVVLHLTGLLPEVIEALNDVGFSTSGGKQRVTLWLVMQGLAALALTLTVALYAARITESRVMASETVDVSTRVVIAKLVRVAAVFLAILIALPIVGIDITALSIFSGALGVGLGFGLQKIASNYVSGFIVLIDHSLRIGDLVTVDNRKGEVKEIASRYTVIKGGDGIESIIPNEKLITESVNHHTYSDSRVSVMLPVTVDYRADVDQACAALLEVAGRQKEVIADPPATARVRSLGERGVDLELSVWIEDARGGDAELRSALFRDILRTFSARGLAFPEPRRDPRLVATPATGELPSDSTP